LDSRQTVALVDTSRYSDLRESVEKALELIGFDFNRKYQKVAIKPNLCFYWLPTSGYTTDPRLVGALVDVLRAHDFAEKIYIVESDASAMRMSHVTRILGYDKLAREKGIELLNLSRDAQLPLQVGDLQGMTIKIPKLLTEVDFFITVPKLKQFGITGITCALKNQFGCIGNERKVAFHKSIHQIIALVNQALPPDLTLVDGIVALGRRPQKLNLVMASYDPVAADCAAARIMGLNPRKIKHIMESKRYGVGSTDARFVGDDLSLFAKAFPRRGLFYDLWRKALPKFYSSYLSLFTVEGRALKQTL